MNETKITLGIGLIGLASALLPHFTKDMTGPQTSSTQLKEVYGNGILMGNVWGLFGGLMLATAANRIGF